MNKPGSNSEDKSYSRDKNAGAIGVDLRHTQPGRSGKNTAPLLPHERDQSSGADATGDPTPDQLSRHVIKQAGDDIRHGRKDTDRGIPSNVPDKNTPG